MDEIKIQTFANIYTYKLVLKQIQIRVHCCVSESLTIDIETQICKKKIHKKHKFLLNN